MISTTDALWAAVHDWVEDPESSVVYAEDVEGRIAVRMDQEARDASTIWWSPGQRSLAAELYLIPAPAKNAESVYRLILTRNRTTYRCWYSLADDGSVVLRSRTVNSDVTRQVLDSVVGEMYEQVEITFRPLLRLAFE